MPERRITKTRNKITKLIKKITQTAVINIVLKRIFIELDVSYASQHTKRQVL